VRCALGYTTLGYNVQRTCTRRAVKGGWEDASLESYDYARVRGSSLATEGGEDGEDGEDGEEGEEGEKDPEGVAVVDVLDVDVLLVVDVLPPSSRMLLVTLVLFLLPTPPRTWVALAPMLLRARGASSSALAVPLATPEEGAEARPERAEGGAAAASSSALMALALWRRRRRRVLSEVGAGLAPEFLREPFLVCPAR
jgi:hypothetical protein